MKHKTQSNPLYLITQKITGLLRLIDWRILVLVMISLAISIGHFKPGLVVSDDGVLMVLRANGFYRSFMDGHWPVRWITQLNETYGYPVTNFLYPLPFYLTTTFMIIGFDALQAFKAVMIFATALSSLTMYMWLKGWSGRNQALIASIFYLLIPYRITDLYTRGSIGEVVIFALVPLVFWRIDKYLNHQSLINLILIGVSWSLIIPAHNSLALLFSALLSLYFIGRLVNISKPKNLQLNPARLWKIFNPYILSILVTLSLSMWFWLPALTELQFTRANQIVISDLASHFANPLVVLLEFGLLSLLITLASVLLIRRKLVWFAWLGIGVSLLLQFSVSQFFWEALTLDKLVQFPFRFLAIPAVLAPLLMALFLNIANKFKLEKIFITLFLLIAFSSTLAKIWNLERVVYPDKYFETNFDTTTNQREFSPKWVKVDPQTLAPSAVEIQTLDEANKIVELHQKTQETFVQLILSRPTQVVFNTHYFPSWKVYADDQLLEITPDQAGRIVVQVTPPPRDNGKVDLKLIWESTLSQQISNLISLLTGIALVSLILYLHSRNLDQTIFWLSIIAIIISLTTGILARSSLLKESFDPVAMEQRYLNSQWVNPMSTHPIGDHGLYTWAGWAYVNGENPILINPEMPPLGKYMIGLGLLLTQRPTVVGLFFSLTFLVALALLSYQVIPNKKWAMVPVALISWESIFRDPLVYPMLDGILLTGLCLAFWALIKADTDNKLKYYLIAGLGLGIVLSSKFYATGLMVAASLVLFYLLSGRLKSLPYLFSSLGLMVGVHALSYWRFFQLGGSLTAYLGVQKWILDFYSQGSPDVPLGSYWMLVFFNRWHVWWQNVSGERLIISSEHWRFTWPLAVTGVIIYGLYLFKTHIKTWPKVKLPVESILFFWIVTYSAFLTLIGGWPHYMLLLLPFAFILNIWLLVKLKKHFM